MSERRTVIDGETPMKNWKVNDESNDAAEISAYVAYQAIQMTTDDGVSQMAIAIAYVLNVHAVNYANAFADLASAYADCVNVCVGFSNVSVHLASVFSDCESVAVDFVDVSGDFSNVFSPLYDCHVQDYVAC